MSPILILGIALGAIAVIGLGVTLVLLLTGDDDKPKTTPTPVAQGDNTKPADDKKDEAAASRPWRATAATSSG